MLKVSTLGVTGNVDKWCKQGRLLSIFALWVCVRTLLAAANISADDLGNILKFDVSKKHTCLGHLAGVHEICSGLVIIFC